MKILVTGSTGFIGSQICRALVAHGYQVRAFHRPTSSLRMLEYLPVEHVTGDLTQPATLEAAMDGVQVVFHVAAMLGRSSDPGRMYAVTVEGTRAVLQAALNAKVERLVHTSSVAALGVPEGNPFHNGHTALINENHTWNYRAARYPYGYAKYLAELEVQKAVAQGLDAVIVNPAGVFGAGDVYRLSNSIIVQVAQGRIPISIPGGWNVVHIDDVVAGHIAALERGQTGERYILGGENLSFQAFLQMIGEVVGKSGPRVTVPAWLTHSLAFSASLAQAFIKLPVDGELLYLAGKYFYYDISKAQRVLGTGEPRPARQAITEAYAWFKENANLRI